MKTAFITGGAEGQGYLLARQLAGKGWRVFAGVLPNAGSKGFADLPNVTTVPQDISEDDSVLQSARTVEAALGGAGLDLVMNVAGVADLASGPLEGIPLDKVRKLFEINTFGPLRVVQAFLPMLRKANPPGRIVNYASGAVLVNPPCSGVYNMTKHAVHGMTLTLRSELAAFGIQVTTIMPGGVLTKMSANAFETTKAMWERTRSDIRKIYEPSLYHPTTQILPKMLEEKGSQPEPVVDEMVVILDKRDWDAFYMVGKDAHPLKPLRKWLPDKMFEGMLRKTYAIPARKA